MFDRFLDRNDMHADACTAGRYHLCDVFQRHLCHQVEECSEAGMLLDEFRVDHCELGTARYEDRDIVLQVMVCVFPVAFHNTDPHQVLHDFLCMLNSHIVQLCKLFDILVGPALFE